MTEAEFDKLINDAPYENLVSCACGLCKEIIRLIDEDLTTYEKYGTEEMIINRIEAFAILTESISDYSPAQLLTERFSDRSQKAREFLADAIERSGIR